eukprot:6481935-Amphidinium_carterae.2
MSSTTLDKACGMRVSRRSRSQRGYKYTIIQPVASPQPAMIACLVEEKGGATLPCHSRVRDCEYTRWETRQMAGSSSDSSTACSKEWKGTLS